MHACVTVWLCENSQAVNYNFSIIMARCTHFNLLNQQSYCGLTKHTYCECNFIATCALVATTEFRIRLYFFLTVEMLLREKKNFVVRILFSIQYFLQ